MGEAVIQRARRLLATTIPQLDQKWAAALETKPELTRTLTVQIGHVVPTQGTFRANRLDIPITWWVNEGNKAAGVDDLYAALSWEDGAGSLVQQLVELDWIAGISTSSIGARIDGPTGFLAADSLVSIVGLKLPDEGS